MTTTAAAPTPIPASLEGALRQVVRGLNDLFPLEVFEGRAAVPSPAVANQVAAAIVDGVARRHYLDEHIASLVLAELEGRDHVDASAQFEKRLRARRTFLWSFNRTLRSELRWRLRRVRANAAYELHYGAHARVRRAWWWCVDYAACLSGYLLALIIGVLAINVHYCSNSSATSIVAEAPQPEPDVDRVDAGTTQAVDAPSQRDAAVESAETADDGTDGGGTDATERDPVETDPEPIDAPTARPPDSGITTPIDAQVETPIDAAEASTAPPAIPGPPPEQPRARSAVPTTGSPIPAPKPEVVPPIKSDIVAPRAEPTLTMRSTIPIPVPGEYEDCIQKCVRTCDAAGGSGP